jgi:uncharacterized protein (TIGR03435 family)
MWRDGNRHAILATPVVDASRTPGTFTLWVDFTPNNGIPGVEDVDLVFHSLEDQGLKLRKGEFPVTYLIVDKMRGTPTEN